MTHLSLAMIAGSLPLLTPVGGWNGRFEGAGNGNCARMLSIEELAHGVLRGTIHASPSPDDNRL